MLAIECDPNRIKRRLETGYLDHEAKDLDEALAIISKHCAEEKAISVGLLAMQLIFIPN